MLRWKDIKEAIEGDPLHPITDDTRLSYVIVHGPQVGFGIHGQDGVMSIAEIKIGASRPLNAHVVKDRELRHLP